MSRDPEGARFRGRSACKYVALVAVCLTGAVSSGKDAFAWDSPLRGSLYNMEVVPFGRPVLAGSLLRKSLGGISGEYEPNFELTLRSALLRDAGLRKSIAESHAVHMNVWVALAEFVPKITFAAEQAYFRDIARPGLTKSRDATVALSATIFSSGSRYFGVKRARAESAAADYLVLAQENSVLTEAVSAYTGLLLARKQSATLRATRENVARLAALTAAAQKRGFADAGDLAQVRAELSFIESDLQLALTEEDKAEIQYKSLTGKYAAPEELRYARHIDIDKIGFEGLIHLAANKNPRVMAQKASAEAATHAARETFGKYLPSVTLNADYERDLIFKREDQWSIGVRLNVPLLDAKAVPEVRKARFESSAAHYAAQDMRHEVERELREIWAEYQGLTRQVGAAGKSVANMQKAATVMKKKYQSGYASIRDVLQVERDLLDARTRQDRLVSKREMTAYRLIIEAGL